MFNGTHLLLFKVKRYDETAFHKIHDVTHMLLVKEEKSCDAKAAFQRFVMSLTPCWL